MDMLFFVFIVIVKVVCEVICINCLIDGVLDVIVGLLVNLWGFGLEGWFNVVFIDVEFIKCWEWVGIDKFVVENGVLIKCIFELYVDFFVIVKGYGVDVVVEYLEV